LAKALTEIERITRKRHAVFMPFFIKTSLFTPSNYNLRRYCKSMSNIFQNHYCSFKNICIITCIIHKSGWICCKQEWSDKAIPSVSHNEKDFFMDSGFCHHGLRTGVSRLTGPTYPLEGKISIGNSKVSYKLERSHVNTEDYEIKISAPDTNIQGFLLYRIFRSQNEWTKQELVRKGGHSL